jgi:hypothetical protein
MGSRNPHLLENSGSDLDGPSHRAQTRETESDSDAYSDPGTDRDVDADTENEGGSEEESEGVSAFVIHSQPALGSC